ncbi:MAG: acetolactate decarboxylase, partial [Candidatus Promineifilaceae bacterium]
MIKNELYLCAPVNALVEGIYVEKIPFTEIKKHGDFGLGTFDHLDGEMIMLNGRIWQIRGDGRVQEVDE